MDVLPIGISKLQLGMFAAKVREDLGRNITKGGDNARLEKDSFPACIAALASFVNEGSVATLACSDNELILRHIHFAFYVRGNGHKSLTHCLSSHLVVDLGSDGQSLIVSGSLMDWKHAVIFYCRPQYPKDVRIIFNNIFNLFNQAQLREVWRDYERMELQDGTFELTYRS